MNEPRDPDTVAMSEKPRLFERALQVFNGRPTGPRADCPDCVRDVAPRDNGRGFAATLRWGEERGPDG